MPKPILKQVCLFLIDVLNICESIWLLAMLVIEITKDSFL